MLLAGDAEGSYPGSSSHNPPCHLVFIDPGDTTTHGMQFAFLLLPAEELGTLDNTIHIYQGPYQRGSCGTMLTMAPRAQNRAKGLGREKNPAALLSGRRWLGAGNHQAFGKGLTKPQCQAVPACIYTAALAKHFCHGLQLLKVMLPLVFIFYRRNKDVKILISILSYTSPGIILLLHIIRLIARYPLMGLHTQESLLSCRYKSLRPAGRNVTSC